MLGWGQTLNTLTISISSVTARFSLLLNISGSFFLTLFDQSFFCFLRTVGKSESWGEVLGGHLYISGSIVDTTINILRNYTSIQKEQIGVKIILLTSIKMFLC